MRNATSMLTVVLAGAWLAGCGSGGGGGGGSGPATVTGTVTYLQRVALPPEARIVVALQDASLPGKMPRTVAQQIIVTRGKQVPIAFRIEYDKSRIDPTHVYSIQAEIRIGDQIRFTSSQTYPVLTRGAPAAADVTVMAVEAAAPVNAPLVGTYWKLVELNGRPAVIGGQGREPHMTLIAEELRAEATGGCNQLTADYRAVGTELKFGQAISTQLACPTGMDQDRALAQAMAATRSCRIAGSRLDLLNGKGAVVATFVAASLEE